MDRLRRLKTDIKQRKCTKVISGINNFDLNKVVKIVKAADAAGATTVDVAAKSNIVFETRKITDMPIFASSVSPKELLMAIKHGADVAELGNFDALYEQGIKYSAETVYKLSVETVELIGDSALICITVPGHLPVKEQVDLAEQLENLGIDFIQTEGSALSKPQAPGALGLIEKATITLANTVELASSVNVPIITASGIGSITAPLAIAAGASGVGIGKFVNSLSMDIEMVAAVRSVVDSITKFRPVRDVVSI